jgi:hypothetical protein
MIHLMTKILTYFFIYLFYLYLSFGDEEDFKQVVEVAIVFSYKLYLHLNSKYKTNQKYSITALS